MTVTPLVMHPSKRIAVKLPFLLIRASRALIIFRSGYKFHGTVFRQIVEKPLPADTCLEAMSYDSVAVLCYRDKMLYRMSHAKASFQNSKLSDGLQLYRFKQAKPLVVFNYLFRVIQRPLGFHSDRIMSVASDHNVTSDITGK